MTDAQAGSPDLLALGFGNRTPHDLIEQCFDSAVTAPGVLPGEAILHYRDESGAMFFASHGTDLGTWCGFVADSPAQVAIHQMLDELVCMATLYGEDGEAFTALTYLASDRQIVRTGQAQKLYLSAIAVDPLVVLPDEAAVAASAAVVIGEGFRQSPRSLLSVGAFVAQNMPDQAVTAVSRIVAEVTAVETRTTALTGEHFHHLLIDVGFPMDLLLPATEPAPAIGEFLVGEVVLFGCVANWHAAKTTGPAPTEPSEPSEPTEPTETAESTEH